jgi:hypothetical protein
MRRVTLVERYTTYTRSHYHNNLPQNGTLKIHCIKGKRKRVYVCVPVVESARVLRPCAPLLRVCLCCVGHLLLSRS